MRKPPERATRMSFDDYLWPEQEFFLFRPDRDPEVLDRGGQPVGRR
jgi:glutamine synthetase